MNLKQGMVLWAKTVWGTHCQVLGVNIMNARYELLMRYEDYHRAEWTHVSYIENFYDSQNSVFSTT